VTDIMVNGRYIDRPGTERLQALAADCNRAVGRLRSLSMTRTTTPRELQAARDRVRDLNGEYRRELARLPR
jgi:hypothetical protein